MSPLERVQAAVKVLERLRAEQTPGPWVQEDGVPEFVCGTETWKSPHGNEIRSIFMAEGNYVDGYAYNEADAELIVTMEHALVPVLSMLRISVEAAEALHPVDWEFAAENMGVLGIADAIVGYSEQVVPHD